MKKTAFIFVICTLFLSSCRESFLELYPETGITSSSFYKTTEHFNQALLASYEGFRYWVNNGIHLDEMRSDNVFYTIYSGDRGPYTAFEKPCLFIDDEDSANYGGGPIYNRWRYTYSNIAKLNTILDRIQTTDINEEDKKKIIAEACFLRASYYFILIRNFGGVPLNLHEVISAEDAFLSRSSLDECYTQILEDVNTAISNGLTVPANFPADNSGRATMGAARMLRAYVNMSKPSPDYAAAEADLKAVTQMNYGLLDNYEAVFDPNNKNHKETILDVQYTEDGTGNQYARFSWKFIPKCENTVDMMGVGGSNYAGTDYSGGWAVPTEEMINSYEANDKRLLPSICVAEGTVNGDAFTFERIVDDPRNYVCPEGKAFRYMARKYYHPPYTYSLKSKENFPVYRYAGTLLLLAEALVQQNKNAEALPYINQVRERAGLPALTGCTLQNVADEMRHELAFENRRWDDLKRTGLVKQVMAAHGERIKNLYPWVRSTNNDGCYKIDDFRMIYAIPTRELDINYLLEQNPGY
jgi:hypothetical protein